MTLTLTDGAGATLGTVDLSGHERWEAGKVNVVTVLPGPNRTAIQLGDRTATELPVSGVAAAEFGSASGALEVRAASRCQADG